MTLPGDPSNPADSSAGSPAEESGGQSQGLSDEDHARQSLDAEAVEIEDDLENLESVIEADQLSDADDLEVRTQLAEFQAERDDYLNQLQRVQAEFQNYKRRVDSQRQDQREQAAADLVSELLPVLDACDAAIGQGHLDVEPVRAQLVQTLERKGLSQLSESGGEFDPNIHEAVMHEEGDGEPTVAEVMRTGYLWNGRVVRAAMVKVRG